jgi:hypothetical protein
MSEALEEGPRVRYGADYYSKCQPRERLETDLGPVASSGVDLGRL